MSIPSLSLVVLVGLGWTVCSAAADDPPKQDAAEAELAAINRDWDQAQLAYRKALDQAKTEKERQQVTRPAFGPYADRCFRLVETHPKSPMAMRALVLVLWNTRTRPIAERAIALLRPRIEAADLAYLNEHLFTKFPYAMAPRAETVFAKCKAKPDDPCAGRLVAAVCLAAGHGSSADHAKTFRDAFAYLIQHHDFHAWSVMEYVELTEHKDPAWVAGQFRTLLNVSKHDRVRQQAAYTLALLLAEQEDQPSQAEAEKWAREGVRIQEAMKAKGQVQQGKGQAAQQLLTKLTKVGIGKAAPEIGGEDLGGQAFKLSDYKGKVILLDFWAFW
jgi:hypothetical protein